MELKLAVIKGNNGGNVVIVNRFPATFGRDEACTYQFSEVGVDWRHFVIDRKNDNSFFIRTLNSQNPIAINNEKVVEGRLNNKDQITISDHLKFQVVLIQTQNFLMQNRGKRPHLQQHEDPSETPSTKTVRRRIEMEETHLLRSMKDKLFHSYRALKTLYEVQRKCDDEPDEKLFDSLLESLFKTTQPDRGAIFLKRSSGIFEGKAFLDKHGRNSEFYISKTILKDVINNGVSVISSDPSVDARYQGSESLKIQKISSLICAPLISQQKVFGAIYLDRVPFKDIPANLEEIDEKLKLGIANKLSPPPFSEEELELIAILGIQVGSSLSRSLLVEKLKNSLDDKEKLLRALQESEERYALAASGANDGLWDWNLQTNTVYYSPRWKSMLGCQDDEVGEEYEEWIVRVHPDDKEAVEMDLEKHFEGQTQHFESEYRILHADGEYRWMLNRGLAVRNKEGGAIRIAGSQTDITKRKNAEQQILHDAFHDALTGIPNRALFIDRLAQVLWHSKRRANYWFAVLFLDLDRFKVVNDSLGHTIGDKLLVEIAKRLQNNLRPGDTISRFGGDEFTILLDDIQGLNEATSIAKKLRDALAAPFEIDKQEVYTNTSVGIVLGSPNYQDPKDILRDADTAMYRAKSLGKAYEIFDTAMHTNAVELLHLENDLRRSLEREEFILYYQPIINLNSGKMVGFESLIRWKHPERGMVSPGEFIPVAERTGFIVAVGWWTIEEACRQICKWQKKYSREHPLSVSVNLSTKQFMEVDLVKKVRQIVVNSGVSPSCLKLEITETILMENAEMIMNMLMQLRAMQVELYIDDFGTGYSSLSYLHRFPISILKVDRSFVSKISDSKENLEIVRAIINLAQNLGMKVVAEGIETPQQLDLLRALGCDYGQGNFFSPASPLEVIEGLIARDPTW